MTKNEQFLANLREMNRVMKQDIKDGHQWTYSNKSSRKGKGFYDTRSKGKYHINCVDGPQWACRIPTREVVPKNALSWYGGQNKGPVWLNANAEKNASKYFDMFWYNGKYTVKQLYDNHMLACGDIFVGFKSMNHTAVYIGGGQSFDSGSGAYTKGHTGEDAVFVKWIGGLSCKSARPICVFRLKDRKHYAIQAGAFNTDKYKERVYELENKWGIRTNVIEEDGMHKILIGKYDDLENAQYYLGIYSKKVNCFIREI